MLQRQVNNELWWAGHRPASEGLRRQVLTGQELEEGWVRPDRSSGPERGDGGYQSGCEKRRGCAGAKGEMDVGRPMGNSYPGK